MSFNKARIGAAMLAVSIFISAAGCSETTAEAPIAAEVTPASLENIISGEIFTDSDKEVGYDTSTAVTIALADNATTASSDGVAIAGNTVTLGAEGTYILSGTLVNGQIIISAQSTDKLRIVLDDANISSDTSAAIYIKQADKVFITLAENSQNSLATKGEFVAIDENSIDATIFSKGDLTINGSGALSVDCASGHGIVSKDDLVITSGTYDVTAASHALSGNDSVRIASASFTLNSGKDAIQAENTDDAALGLVYIESGRFAITSEGDGISASAAMQIESGTFDITSGGGSANSQVAAQEEFPDRGSPSSQVATDAADTVSAKGIKATGNMLLNGGGFSVDSADDALHSNANIAIADGTFTITTGDDGVHADANTTISGGTLTVVKSYEGIEGQSIDITGGIISVTATDDGLNSAGGNDTASSADTMGGRRQDSFAADANAYIRISGGTVTVDATGDGVDSNGNLYVTGGETYVAGPTNTGNGALDYNGDAQITGGIFAAVDAGGMSQNFGTSSTQGAMLVSLTPTSAGQELTLKDSAGATILTYAPPKEYASVVISCPEIKQGESYTITSGEQSVAVEMMSLIYGTSGMGDGGGRPNGTKSSRPAA